MLIDIDVDTKKLGCMDVTVQGVSDVTDSPADVALALITKTIATTTGESRSRITVEISISGGNLLAEFCCDHVAASSMRASAAAAKTELESAGHTVTYTEVDTWTPDQKKKAKTRKVPGFNLNSIR